MKDYSTPAEGILKREADGTIASQEVTEVELVGLAAVATSGSYNDLIDKPTMPTIPTVGDATITIKQGSATKGSFTTNQSSGKTITLDANTDTLGKNIVGTSVTASVNGEVSGLDGVYLNHIEGTNTVKSSHKIVGSGATTVKSDADGNITINTPAAPVTSVNSKTGAVELSASDVGAVDLTGDQTIAGNKTFSGDITFNLGFMAPGSSFTGGCSFKGQQSFDDGMAVDGQTYYKENSYISGKIHYDEDSTVDFTDATVTGLHGLLPTVTALDNGKFLRVVNGAWAPTTIPSANGGTF